MSICASYKTSLCSATLKLQLQEHLGALRRDLLHPMFLIANKLQNTLVL